MRPVLKPGLRRTWRDPTTLQLGVDPARAVIVRGVDGSLAGALDLLDGSRLGPEIVADAAERGIDERGAAALLGLLARAGALDDAGLDPLLGLAGVSRERLAPDVSALSLLHPDPGRGGAALGRRRAARVRVEGAGRVGAQVALLLAAAGVGAVDVVDDGLTTPSDLAPGGLGPAAVGRPRGLALAAALGPPASPAVASGPTRLVVLAPPGLGAAPRPEDGIPHLLVAVRETTAIIGPLVLPGLTACLLCVERHRAERDPGWPLVAAQLSRPPRGGVDACDVALSAVAAGTAVLQVLAWLDAAPDSTPPATAGGTLELAMPDWRVRRRSWPVHPSCSCVAQ